MKPKISKKGKKVLSNPKLAKHVITNIDDFRLKNNKKKIDEK